jgi:hypothetical protein
MNFSLALKCATTHSLGFFVYFFFQTPAERARNSVWKTVADIIDKFEVQSNEMKMNIFALLSNSMIIPSQTI